MRAAAGTTDHPEMTNAKGVGNLFHISDAVDDPAARGPFRHPVTRPIVGDQMDPYPAKCLLVCGKTEPRSRSSVQPKHGHAGQITPLRKAELPPLTVLYLA